MSVVSKFRSLGTIRVTRRSFNIEDPGATCWEEAERIDESGTADAWYVNPMFTVHSATPDTEFFAEARKHQGIYFRELSLRMQGHRWRAKRKIDRSNLSQEDFNLAYDGVFVINESLLTTKEFAQVEMQYLRQITVSQVIDAFGLLRKNDLSLFDFMLEKRHQLESYPENSWFLIPSCLIRAEKESPEFKAECQNQWRQWKGRICWLLKQRQITPEFADAVRKLRFSSDLSLESLLS